MDLLVAIAVWAAGAWLAYRWARARPRPGPTTPDRARRGTRAK